MMPISLKKKSTARAHKVQGLRQEEVAGARKLLHQIKMNTSLMVSDTSNMEGKLCDVRIHPQAVLKFKDTK
jgi:hypothetical protein